MLSKICYEEGYVAAVLIPTGNGLCLEDYSLTEFRCIVDSLVKFTQVPFSFFFFSSVERQSSIAGKDVLGPSKRVF